METGQPVSSGWNFIGWLTWPLALIGFCSLIIPGCGRKTAEVTPPASKREDFNQGILVAAAQLTTERIETLRAENPAVVAINISDGSGDAAAARRVLDAGLPLYYWIEIGRCPELADAHPEWMASIQTHTEWRRGFPDFPKEREGEVVKAYPWVPVLYRETVAAHLARVGKLLGDLPPARGIFLNDLQGPPSACGCGHMLCRWTTDYGPIKTATPLGPDAAAKFCAEVGKLSPNAEIIPVWTSECEEPDRATVCGGVNCYRGTCWKEWTRQTTPLAAECPRIAALLPYKLFERDLPHYGGEGAWVAHAIKSFGDTPQGQHPVPAQRLIAVVQGWDVTAKEVEAQKQHAAKSGCGGVLVAMSPLEQSWEPRIFRWKK
ncbi:MAG: hypothetical protein ACR2OZ_08585 [Verrucomicrobiales bacterium]